MTLRGTDPESYITEYALAYEENTPKVSNHRPEMRAKRTTASAECVDRIGTGPPLARTEVIYADLGY